MELIMQNREIKFRIWDEKMNTWETCRQEFYPGENILKQGRILQQFTGLRDKNGREIYEGDIIKYIWEKYEHDIEDSIGEVYFDNGIFFFNREQSFCMIDSNFFENSIEIIGNIFENPELLDNKDV
jgi:uncharacterized phage protein (TIGR01671 family)